MNRRQIQAMDHPDVLGAGAEKRRKLPPDQRAAVIRAEFDRGTLYSGSGKKVRTEAQMRAIQHHEGHPSGDSHPDHIKRTYKDSKH